ncbi:MAG: alpha/beta hydrolase [Alphaproteobacteria bacterium]|nr:alpha/beta hydrolase [Alphaproteobacteria bacterium]
MTTFVLVHGAWHGGWCWKRVSPFLRAKGHDVFAPTLSGGGETAHLAAPSIGLQTHIENVCGLIEKEELRDCVLVGHSYGGMVIAGVAERLHKRIASIVYLDAFVPEDGQALMSLTAPERMRDMVMNAIAHGDGWRVPPPPPSYFGVKTQADADWITSQCTPQALLTFMQPVQAQGAWKSIARKMYIRAAGHPLPTFARFGDALRNDPAWIYRETTCGHEVMIEQPQELAGMLLELA